MAVEGLNVTPSPQPEGFTALGLSPSLTAIGLAAINERDEEAAGSQMGPRLDEREDA
jgi:hypothetical protein